MQAGTYRHLKCATCRKIQRPSTQVLQPTRRTPQHPNSPTPQHHSNNASHNTPLRQTAPPYPTQTLPHLPHPGRDSGRGGWPEAVVSWHVILCSDVSKSTGRKLRALCDVPGFRLIVKNNRWCPACHLRFSVDQTERSVTQADLMP